MALSPTRVITSRQNSRVKELRAVLQHPGRNADRDGRLIAFEGRHLLEEALRSGTEIITIFVAAGAEKLLHSLQVPAGTEVLVVENDLLESVATTEAAQPIAALARAPACTLEDLLAPSPALVVIAAGLQDPGNLGTLVRSAEAFGATGCALLPGTVSLWNPKTLRASAGSAFRLPVVPATAPLLFPALRDRSIQLLAAVPGAASPSIDLRQPTALLIGNEGAGLAANLLEAADATITIPCPGPVESLNAAIAGSILLYECSRQRAAHL